MEKNQNYNQLESWGLELESERQWRKPQNRNDEEAEQQRRVCIREHSEY